jgi:hypothetical protein
MPLPPERKKIKILFSPNLIKTPQGKHGIDRAIFRELGCVCRQQK